MKTTILKKETQLTKLEERYQRAKEESRAKYINLGWGAGMRRSKISISTTKEDNLRGRIDILKQEINELKKNTILIKTAIYIPTGETVQLTDETRDLYGQEEMKVIFPNGDVHFEFMDDLNFEV